MLGPSCANKANKYINCLPWVREHASIDQLIKYWLYIYSSSSLTLISLISNDFLLCDPTFFFFIHPHLMVKLFFFIIIIIIIRKCLLICKAILKSSSNDYELDQVWGWNYLLRRHRGPSKPKFNLASTNELRENQSSTN